MAVPISRYDQPAEAQFINTYVPIPFDDIMKIGLLKQARIDEDMAGQERMVTEMSSFDVAPGDDETRREEKLAELRKDIGNIQGQLGFLDWRQGLADVRSKYASDPEMINLKKNVKPFAELTKALQKAQEEGITPANKYELEQKINEYYNIGARGFKEKYGSGQLTPSSYYANVDAREELKEWSADVKPSSTERQYIDPETDLYRVTAKNSEITMSAVGRPYGITFDKEYKNGRLTLKPNIEMFAADGFQKIMNSPAGMQIRRDAAQNLRDRGGTVTSEALQQEEFRLSLSHINSIIQEKIHTDSSVTYDADPYKLIAYRQSFEDVEDTFSRPIPMATKGSLLTNSASVDAAKNTAVSGVDDVLKRKSAAAFTHGGVREEVQTFKDADGNTFTRKFYTGADGIDVTDEMKKFDLEFQAFNKDKEDIENLERKFKAEAGLKEDYVPTPEVILGANQAGMAAVSVLSSRTDPYDLSRDPNKPLSVAEQKVYDNAYRRVIEKTDPNWARYNELLKEGAKTNVMDVGIARFASKALNDEAERDGLRYLTENRPGRLGGHIGKLEWVQPRKGPFDNKDYESLSNAIPPMFDGTVIDPIDGKLKFIYRFHEAGSTKEKPILTDPIKTNAPDGVGRLLVRSGKIEEAELYFSQILSDVGLGEDKASDAINMPDSFWRDLNLKPGEEEKYKLSFETLTSDEVLQAPIGAVYRLKIPEINAGGTVTKTVKTYPTKQDVITDIISYYRTVSSLIRGQTK